MKKLLELKSLDTEVRELLHTIEKDIGIYLCVHLHHMQPKISIYTEDANNKAKTQIMSSNVIFEYEMDINEEIVYDIIHQIEKVMQ